MCPPLSVTEGPSVDQIYKSNCADVIFLVAHKKTIPVQAFLTGIRIPTRTAFWLTVDLLKPTVMAADVDTGLSQFEIVNGVDPGMQPKIKEIIEKHGLHPSFSMSPTFTEKWGCQMIAYMLNAIIWCIFVKLILDVCKLCLFGTLQFIFLSHQVYTDYVIRFSQEARLNDIVFRNYQNLTVPTSSGIRLELYVCSTKQTSYNYLLRFFVTRIWVLSPPEITRKLMYTGPVLLLAVCQIGKSQTLRLFFPIQRITSTQAGTTAACDILIAVILCMLLHKARSGFQRLCALLNLIFILAHNSMSFLLRQYSDFPLQNINLNTSTTIQMHQETFTFDDQHQVINNESQKDSRFTRD
ncbi:hypothetical protein EV359DRAFT_67296 [Lentinula novae-zelandiae]|nr:hypothetical protein EV359DRAFT_67296 [Lentinula novae-zelandiae]